MPNTSSAKKRMRQDSVRRARNRATKADLRAHLRKVRAAIAAKKLDESEAGISHARQEARPGRLRQCDSRQRRRPHQVAALARD